MVDPAIYTNNDIVINVPARCQAIHPGSPEQGKRAEIFFEKGPFQAQNRATKTRCEGVFRCRGTL